jgi:DUF971 family protein
MQSGAELTATEIKLRTRSRLLEVAFGDGSRFELPFEYLRVYSPSAEVRGHGGEPTLVAGKENVGVQGIEPIGHYAVRLLFDDGHNTGLYTWKYLYELGVQRAAYWSDYLARLERAGQSRQSVERRDPPR